MKIYYYPTDTPPNRDFVKNPYSDLFKKNISKYYNVVNENSKAEISILDLLKNVFKVECVIFNWIENLHTRKFGSLQFMLFLFILLIMKIRRIRILWILHNFHPHKGEHKISNIIKNLMFRNSHLIATHSKAAELYAQERTNNKVVFYNHPINPALLAYNTNHNSFSNKSYDILIWGSIEPYKGILEFLQFVNHNNIKWKIKITGRCKSKSYENQIQKFMTNDISFDNIAVPFENLSTLIKSSKFVLFPYKSKSVSSSGALMDTIALFGNIIGPNTGAFKELEENNICKTFNSYEDIEHIVNSNKQNNINACKDFIKENSWSSFAKKIKLEINKL